MLATITSLTLNQLPSDVLNDIMAYIPKEDPTRLAFRASCRAFRDLIPVEDTSPSRALSEAVERGYANMLKWLSALSPSALSNALLNKQWSVLSWMGTTGLAWTKEWGLWNDRVYSAARTVGEIAENWYREYNDHFLMKHPLGQHASEMAERARDFDGLQWLYTQFPKLHRPRPGIVEAELGHVDMLQWLRDHKEAINPQICQYAASHGHLSVLKWAQANNFPLEFHNCQDRYFPSNAIEPVEEAAQRGHVDCVRWLIEQNVAVTEDTCSFAAGGGKLDVVKLLIEKRNSWSSSACLNGFLYGTPEIIGFVYNWLKNPPEDLLHDPNRVSFLRFVETSPNMSSWI